MLDVKLLAVMRIRNDYKKLRPYVQDSTLDSSTIVLLRDYEAYFKKFKGDINYKTFLSWFTTIRHKDLTSEQKASYTSIFRNVCKTKPDEDVQSLKTQLSELKLATDLANLTERWNNGDCEHLVMEAQQQVQEFKRGQGMKTHAYIDDSISDILKEESDESGVHFRLNALNSCMRGMRPGDSIIIGARPDKGKTTFFASEATFIAPQLPSDRGIVWLNNEGKGKRIYPRLYQAALDLALSDLHKLNNEGKLIEAYTKVVGDPFKIKVVDVHGWSTLEIEDLLEDLKPGLAIGDMIDHFRLPNGSVAARLDSALEDLYVWWRELMCRIDCIGWASSQISVEGAGKQFPKQEDLKDSKTGKQGACDAQIMIGALNDPNLQAYRYLSLPKNKLRREGAPGDPLATVLFNPGHARYEDITEEEDE